MNRLFLMLTMLASTLFPVWAQLIPGLTSTQTVMVAMRDGVKLSTDIYLPSGSWPFPTILLRSPYDKSKAGAIGPTGVSRGYAVVIQDTRGRYASEGQNLPFNLDGPDGRDTVEWIIQQAWCNGKIGTYGGSALGITQYQLAGAESDHITCQHITVGAPNLYGDVVYTGGVLRKSMIEDWLRVSKFDPRALEIWTGHWLYDRYWADRDTSKRYRQINTPALHIGGYFDIFAQGTIDAFTGYQTKGGPLARGKQKLLMGPWSHGVFSDRAGELAFPDAKSPPNKVQDQWKWWDYHLKGVLNGVADLPPVTYYVMGDVSDRTAPGNVWRTAESWPPLPTEKTRWYLHADLTFSVDRPRGQRTITYLSDPKKPVPTVGGYNLTIPAGPKDQRQLEERSDVIVFSSEPLTAPLEVTGAVEAKLYVKSDAVDTDFLVRLCDVYPDGRSFNVCESIQRMRFRNSFEKEEMMKPGWGYTVKLRLWPTSIVFNRGHRLRVHICSTSDPAYDPNPNTGEPLRWSQRSTIAANTIYCGSSFPSHLDLPVVKNRVP